MERERERGEGGKGWISTSFKSQDNVRHRYFGGTISSNINKSTGPAGNPDLTTSNPRP